MLNMLTDTVKFHFYIESDIIDANGQARFPDLRPNHHMIDFNWMTALIIYTIGAGRGRAARGSPAFC